MEDLINTVQRRYGRSVSYRSLSTLSHRQRTAPSRRYALEENHFGSLLNFLHPQITSFSQKLHEEVSRLIERREKTALQTLNKEIPRLIGLQAQKWRTENSRTDKIRLEAAKRMEQRVELFTADTSAKLKAVQRELERLKLSEKARRQKESKAAYDYSSFRAPAKATMSEHSERERDDLRREISSDIARTERRITRKLRDEDEYEKRRRG